MSSERAKRIIVEIVRQAGGIFYKKTNLFKAFYRAHLFFAKNNPGYLSEYPIVRMPRGPGIDRADHLFGQLRKAGYLQIATVKSGDFDEIVFTLGRNAPSDELTEAEISAIRHGVQQVVGKSAIAVSKRSHIDSRSWQNSKSGQELDIYIDLLSDEEYERLRSKMEKTAAILDTVWDS